MLRIGAVSYLNTKPLIEGLREGLDGRASLSLNLPSRLADDLRGDRLDIALVPSVESFRLLDGRVVSDAAIGCVGPVWSVRLVSRVPAAKIRTLALDVGSRTSAAMVQVLLFEKFGIRPTLIPLAMDDSPEHIDADASLIIGDRAMHPERGVYREIWDLGDRWVRRLQMPFVFAMWVARPGLDLEHPEVHRVVEEIQMARDLGVTRLDEIARRHAAMHGLTDEDLERYFRDNLHFYLGEPQVDALRHFRDRCISLGLVPAQANWPLDHRPSHTEPLAPTTAEHPTLTNFRPTN